MMGSHPLCGIDLVKETPWIGTPRSELLGTPWVGVGLMESNNDLTARRAKIEEVGSTRVVKLRSTYCSGRVYAQDTKL